MRQCVLITLTVGSVEGFIDNFIRKYAGDLQLEGDAKFVADGHVRIVVCGHRDNVDNFIDLMYEKSGKYSLDDIQIESFFKERDYRGVFRVIA